MAAASAGALQSGSAVASGNVDQQVSAALQQHQQQHNQQQQQQQQLHHQLLHHQQQIRPQHHKVHFQSTPQALHQQRHPFVPRAGNRSQSQLRHNVNTSGGSVGVVEQQSAIINNNHTLASNVTKQPNPMLQCQPQTAVAANLAPGWRRLFTNNEIIYVSPTGASLRTHVQIKDYLLSPNTCKCGLPCPLRPEYFFDFNSQVPNTPLQIPLENGLPTRSSVICMHQRRYFESQQNIPHKDIKRRKYNDISGAGKISTSPVPQCNSVAVYSGNVMQTSQLMTNNPRMQMMAPQTVPNMPYPGQQKQTPAENEKQIGSVTLSKTPPWRKNSILQHQNSQPAQSANIQQIYAAGNERVPPLPQAHLQQTQSPTPPWQQQQQQDYVQPRFVKTRQSPSTSKKKPNFKDDPTGYLDHQTAILHSSILNVVNSPDLNDSPSMDDTNYTQSIKDESIEDESSNKNELSMSVIQQQQHHHHHQNQILYPRNLNQSVEVKQHEHQHHQQQHGIVKHQRLQPAPPPPSFAYHQGHPRMIAPSQIGEKQLHQLQQQQQQHQQPPHLPSQQHQHVLANVPSSQQFLVDKHNQLIRNQQFLTDHDHQQATTTTIGGQTVTHFPNGMVQVEQNCDNNLIPLKPQQQIQLQQQIHQHNMLYRQNQHIQKTIGKVINEFPPTSSSSSMSCHNTNPNHSEQKIGASQESPVSSSTTFNRGTPERRPIQDSKGPPQVGAISTSNESPIACPSPADSESTSSSIKSSPSPVIAPVKSQQGNIFGSSQTSARNTITSVQAGRTITATTTSSISDKNSISSGAIPEPQPTSHRDFHHQTQKLSPNNIIPVSSSLPSLQLQSVVREPGNQLIMTSTGQLIVMPTQPNKSTNQVIINSPNGNNLVHQQSMVINQQGVVNSVDVSNSTANHHLIQNSPNGLVIQNSGLVQPSANMIQSAGNLISNTSQNFIVNSSNNMQPMILNNSNFQQNGQNLNIIQNPAGSSLITTGPNGTKVISSNGNILNQTNVIGNSGNLISPNSSGLIGQQTVVLNTLPNGYVIQPNFTTVDGQMVGQIVNQDGGTTSFLQQQARQIILTSPDSKRKGKKRKSSASSSPSTPSSLSPQSPNIHQQQSSLVQLTSQYPTQGFQISPGIQGITMVNKNTQSAGPQQQIIFQNGQIIQPMNLIGQQLLVPAGLVVAPETTLLQIQNIGPCGNIITPQGMVLRAQSPQNKNFLSPNGPTGQQFIVSSNSQMSPIGQLYGAPVSLVVPQSNSGAATFVQQNTTIVQQQTTMMGNNNNSSNNNDSTSSGSSSTHQEQSQHHVSASPPDTTTHSPRSPERPPSERSGGSDMVQCVSSSEPDSVVSPVAADSAQSPSTTDYDRSSSNSYQTNSNVYKPSDPKIRRVQTPPQFNATITQDTSNQMRPDSHESPTNSPAASSATSTTSSSSSSLIGGSVSVGGGISGNFNVGHGQTMPSFSIGQLVWGAARGHPAWPGKVVNPPDGSCTPSDSTWVQWFGGRSIPELVAIVTLKSLSEGLEAHHKAQKDTRKSRKLNQQLERAIQEAMTELDRISMMAQPTSTTQNVPTTPSGKGKNRGRQPASTLGHQRTKPIRIAPAPPCTSSAQHQIRQPGAQHQHHIQQNHQQQQQQQHLQQTQHAQPTTQTK